MSLRGYRKKWGKAPWAQLHPPEAAPKPTRRWLRSASTKRAQQLRQYRMQAAEFVRQHRHEMCPVVRDIKELFWGKKYGHPISAWIVEVHHTRGRAGGLLLDEQFWMAVSKAGHRWIHAHPAEARRRGWLCAVGEWNTPP